MKLGNYLSAPILTQEAIAYQRNHPAGGEFELLFASFKKMVDEGAKSDVIEARRDLKKEFNSLCRKHFGINAVLITDTLMAATIPNVYTVMSPAVRTEMYSFYDTMRTGGIATLSNLGDVHNLGTVDSQNAKLRGWFSEQETQLFLNMRSLFGSERLTVAEVTAVCFHELGHNFEGASASSRSNGINLVLSDVARHILDKKRDADRDYIYRELKSLDSTLTKDTIDGLMSGEPTVMGVSAFRVAKGMFTELSGSAKTSDSSFEAISDSFATRLGYGEHLATGLEKVTKIGQLTSVALEMLEMFVFWSAVASTISLLRIIISSNITAKLLISLLLSAMAVVKILNRNKLSNIDKVYDNDKDRFTRIKHDVINGLKNPGITSAIRKQTLEQLDIIARIEDRAFNTPKPLQQLMMYIMTDDKRTSNSIAAQQDFEKLIANDIFVSANRLLTVKS